MQRHARKAGAVLLIGCACALASANSSASRSISTAGGPGLSASGILTVGNEPGLELTQLSCDITLLRTITSAVPKAPGTLFGKVTGIAIDRGTSERPHCRLRGIRTLEDIRGLPGPHRELGNGVLLWDLSRAEARLWVLVYDSFQGTLPRITGVNIHINNIQVLWEFTEGVFGQRFRCLYEGTVFGLIRITEATGVATGAEVVLAQTRLAGTTLAGSAQCPRVTASGTFAIAPAVTIRLL
jgi:hypothetical protein